MSKLPPPPTKNPTKRPGPPPPPKITKKPPVRPVINQEQLVIEQNTVENNDQSMTVQKQQRNIQIEQQSTAPTQINNNQGQSVKKQQLHGTTQNQAINDNTKTQQIINRKEISSEILKQQQDNINSQLQITQLESNQNFKQTQSQTQTVRRPPPVPNRKQPNLPNKAGLNQRKNVPKPPIIKTTIQQPEQPQNQMNKDKEQLESENITINTPIINPNLQHKEKQVHHQKQKQIKNINQVIAQRKQVVQQNTQHEQVVQQIKAPPTKIIPSKPTQTNSKILNKVVPRPKFQAIRKTEQKPQLTQPQSKQKQQPQSNQRQRQQIQQTPTQISKKKHTPQSEIPTATNQLQLTKSKSYQNKSSIQVSSLTPKYSNLMTKLKDFSMRREKMLESSSEESDSEIHSQTHSQMDKNKERVHNNNKQSKNTKSVSQIKKQFVEKQQKQREQIFSDIPMITNQPQKQLQKNVKPQITSKQIPQNVQPKNPETKLSKNKSASLLTQPITSVTYNQANNNNNTNNKTSFKKQVNKIQVIEYANTQQNTKNNKSQEQHKKVQEEIRNNQIEGEIAQIQIDTNLQSKQTILIRQVQEQEHRENSPIIDTHINLYHVSQTTNTNNKNNKSNDTQKQKQSPHLQLRIGGKEAEKINNKIPHAIKKNNIHHAAPNQQTHQPPPVTTHHPIQQPPAAQVPISKMQQIAELLKKFTIKKQQYLRNAQQLSDLCERNRSAVGEKISIVNSLLLKLQEQNMELQNVIRNY